MKHTQRRPTIGFLAPGIHVPIVHALWPGVLDAARQYDVNLVYFAGEPVQAQQNFQGQANILYELISQESVDGLISWASTIYYDLDQEAIDCFHARYQSLPIVCIGKTMAGCPSVGIVLYTDGITEAENVKKQQYGIERLCQVISQHWEQSAEAIKQAVINDVLTHIGTHTMYDDVTLVVLKQT